MKIKVGFTEFNRRCNPINGLELVTYGIPYLNAIGAVFSMEDEEHIIELLDIVKHQPELHIASFVSAMDGVNDYVEGKSFYFLCKGDADPNIILCPDMSQLEHENMTQSDRMRAQLTTQRLFGSPSEGPYQAVKNWYYQKSKK